MVGICTTWILITCVTLYIVILTLSYSSHLIRTMTWIVHKVEALFISIETGQSILQHLPGDCVHVEETHWCDRFDMTSWFYQDLDPSVINTLSSQGPAGDGDTSMDFLSLPLQHRNTPTYIPTLPLTCAHTHTHQHAVFFGGIIVCHPWLSSNIRVSLALILASHNLAGSIRKGQSDSVCTFTLSTCWTCCLLIYYTQTPQWGADLCQLETQYKHRDRANVWAVVRCESWSFWKKSFQTKLSFVNLCRMCMVRVETVQYLPVMSRSE